MIKLLVEIEFGNPILRGTKIRLDEEMIWVEFRYENLPTFSFYCGRIGHSERGCEHKMEDSRRSYINEGKYGSWLKAQLVKGGKKGVFSGTRTIGNLSNKLVHTVREKGDRAGRGE